MVNGFVSNCLPTHVADTGGHEHPVGDIFLVQNLVFYLGLGLTTALITYMSL